eukprot:13136016-Heterocapsa_arctica.AAC.1
MDGKVPRAVTATGSPLVIYGVRTVRCTTWHGVQFELDFVVSDVTRPIVAVNDLLSREMTTREEKKHLNVKTLAGSRSSTAV